MRISTLRRVIKYLGKYRVLMFVSLFLSVLTVAGQLYIPVLQGHAVDRMIGAGQVNLQEIGEILLRILLTVAFVAIFQWVMNTCNNKITYAVIKDIRKDAFDKLQHVPVRYADQNQTGTVVSKVIADVDQFADGLLMGFAQFFTGIMTILGTLLFMLLINWKITLIVVVLTPLSFFLASFVAKKTYSMFQGQSEARAAQTSFVDEMIGNQKVVQAYSQEEVSQKIFDQMNDRLTNYSLKAIFYSSATNPGTRFLNNIIYGLVCLYGAFVAMAGGISVGQLSVMLMYANQYTKPFNEISGVITELQNALACADRVLDLIDEKVQTPDGDLDLEIPPEGGRVELKDVCFSYEKGQKLIRNFNLQVRPGKRVAIVGPTGCGKTTLINLLMRFYDVESGGIYVEGEDIRSVTRKSLRSAYGMVLQDTWLQTGTIQDNIRTGRPDATREEVIEAAKSAHAHSFIKRLPQGYDTLIGEDGGSLSQGQKQLLCIARVMLSLPPMLILDEATSSIDTRTEQKIQAAFAQMMKGRTSFIVAHRLSTIRSADIILVMKDGDIIEQGNHEELMAAGGFYRNLYESQFQ